MKKQFEIAYSATPVKLDVTLGFDGKIIDILLNSLLAGKAEKLTACIVSILLNNVRVIEDWRGSDLDKLPLINQNFLVDEVTIMEIQVEWVDDKDKAPLIVTTVYEPLEGKVVDFRG